MAVVVNPEEDTQGTSGTSSTATEAIQQPSSDDEAYLSDDDIDTPMSTNFPATCSSRYSGTVMRSKGDSFCDCHKKGKEKECVCGEENTRKIHFVRWKFWQEICKLTKWKLIFPKHVFWQYVSLLQLSASYPEPGLCQPCQINGCHVLNRF